MPSYPLKVLLSKGEAKGATSSEADENSRVNVDGLTRDGVRRRGAENESIIVRTGKKISIEGGKMCCDGGKSRGGMLVLWKSLD
jgi:hypothetical protein